MRTLYLAAFLLLAAGLGLVVPAQGAGPLVATTSGTPVPYAWSTASEVQGILSKSEVGISPIRAMSRGHQ